MPRDDLRKALGEAPLPAPEQQWMAIRARLADAAPRRRRVSAPVVAVAGLAALVLGVGAGSYWQFAAPARWAVVGGDATLDTSWTEIVTDTLRLAVGRIGQVSLAPGSRARVRRGAWNEHRLELERGALRAVIAAPPRLFFVETPSALATDLGCAYELQVLPDGGTALHVTAGWVELASGDARSIVPAGLTATVAADGVPGVPFDPALPPEARAALQRLANDRRAPADSATTPARDLERLLRALDTLDAERAANIRRQSSGITLWHLLQRVAPERRPRVLAALAARAAAPPQVTREGILALDRQMLDRWRRALHPMWGESASPIVALAQRLWLSVMD